MTIMFECQLKHCTQVSAVWGQRYFACLCVQGFHGGSVLYGCHVRLNSSPLASRIHLAPKLFAGPVVGKLGHALIPVVVIFLQALHRLHAFQRAWVLKHGGKCLKLITYPIKFVSVVMRLVYCVPFLLKLCWQT